MDPLTGAGAFSLALDELEKSGRRPVLSASFDLRPDGSGAPVAPRILREALRVEAGRREVDLDAESLAERLGATLSDAASEGPTGIFVAGPLDEPTRWLALVPVPPRNRLSVTDAPSRFELERHLALTRIPVAVAWADRTSVAWAMVRSDGEPVVGQVEADPHFMRGSLGRTGQHDRGGSAETPAGGHSKVRIEESAEEERDRFAREAAQRLGSDVIPAEILVLHGPQEFRARLMAELPPGLQERIEPADGPDPDRQPGTEELVAEARERAVGAQYERAAREVEAIAGGAFGERAAIDQKSLIDALAEGRVDRLVVHEDAVLHFGDAIDARRHEPRHDEAHIEGLLRSALAQSATCWFAAADALDDADDGAVGALRW